MADRPVILLAGASRGLGLAMARAFLARDWDVIGTVRAQAGTGLHELQPAHGGRLRIETLNVTDADATSALRQRFGAERLAMLFVNAGTIDDASHTRLGDAEPAEFARVMATNVLGPMRIVETFTDLVVPGGPVGVMSSLQGSVSANRTGGLELYRASKAALNQAMRSHAARAPASRPLTLMVPGWVRTDMGGPDADLDVDDSARGVVDVLIAKRDRPGLKYLDHLGGTVPW